MEVTHDAKVASLPAHRTVHEPLRMGSVYVDRLPWEGYVGCLVEMMESKRRLTVASCDSQDLIRAHKDHAFRELLLSSSLVLGTGPGMRMLARLKHAPLKAAPTPRKIVDATLLAASDHAWRVFFLGGREHELFNAAHEAPRRHPGLRVVGAHKGLSAHDDARAARRLVDRVNASGADIIIGAPRNPKGEAFAYRHREELAPRLTLNVWTGFHAGIIDRLKAPASTLPAFLAMALQLLRT